jgi:hypothetical protein
MLLRPLPSYPIGGCNGACLSSQAVWEAEIGRIMVPSQPWQKKEKEKNFARSHLIRKKNWMWYVMHLSFQLQQEK